MPPLPSKFDPMTTGIANYPEGSLVWFDPSGENQIVCDNMAIVKNAGYLFMVAKELTYWDLDMPKTTSLEHAFNGARKLESFTADLSSCTTMSMSFNNCTALKHFNGYNLDKVTSLYSTFSGCTSLKEIHLDLPNVKDAYRGIFISGVKKFSGNLPKLSTAVQMLASWSIEPIRRAEELIFDSYLPSLSDGTNMFNCKRLDADSVKRILTSIPKWPISETHNLNIGAQNRWKNDTEIANMLGTTVPILGTPAGITYRCYEINEDGTRGEDKGWTITVQDDIWHE